jgi:hypothetical protein
MPIITNFVRQPRAHQLETFERSKDAEYFGLFFEQRTGKSKVAVDTAAHLYLRWKIDAVFLLGPNSVKRSWAEDHFPADMPTTIPYHSVIWDSSSYRSEKDAKTVFGRKLTNDLNDLLTFRGLAILIANHQALLTENLKKYIGRFLRRRRTLLIIDEIDEGFSRPGGKQYRTASFVAKLCPYRRILTGTPVPEGSPLDLYAPVRLLHSSIFGFGDFTSFKARYAEYETRTFMKPRVAKNGHTRETYPALKGYINLDEIKERLAPYTARVCRADITDAPAKTYQRRYFELTPTQRRTYDALRDRYRTEIQGRDLSAVHVLARITRLQQIACNSVPFDEFILCRACLGTDDNCEVCDGVGVTVDERNVLVDPRKDPRIDTLRDELIRSTGPAVVWCRFRQSITTVVEMCHQIGRHAGRYDGSIKQAERDATYAAFRSGAIDTFVGIPAAGGRGLDLSLAEDAYYHSNSYSLRHRTQSEDRTESLTKKFGTAVIDFVAEDTVDGVIVDALRDKRSLADRINGEGVREVFS